MEEGLVRSEEPNQRREFMISAPWTEVGRLQQEMSQVHLDLYRKADKHEISSTNSNVVSLEREIGDLRSTLDGIRIELQELQEGYRELLGVVGTMTSVIG